MQAISTLTPLSLETVLQRIFAIGRITRRDQQLLMSTLLSKEDLNEKERQQISRVFDGVQKGLLKVVD
ncbi:hypothetical protein Nos7524_0691 [Nostoc sp. PCC 7524]|jgi:hypothetical protein|uniref:hypothetical protein n=1 Tax=Nostoc sp. (strain ATCC 29411 / PCC 7524) TaxID=28072 RepID=UPI00029F25B0|nr:hypothetical protein [Nostoc sp. PCC 7524]AFY46597.1 hypothetical protein Nos7524_0691 [Nostoc sp. PCC 7524]